MYQPAGTVLATDPNSTRTGAVRRVAVLWLVLCLAVLPGVAARAQSGAFAGPGDQPNAFGAPSAPPSSPRPPPAVPAPAYSPPPAQPQAEIPVPPRAGGQPEQRAPAQHAAAGAQQFLVSLWHGQATDDAGSWEVYVTFRPDGTYVQQQTLNGSQFQLASSGRYNAQFVASGGVIMFNPQQWSPRRFCPSASTCRPVNLPAVLTIKFHLLSQDVVQTDGGLFQRIGPGR